jgi:hypothetical protein
MEFRAGDWPTDRGGNALPCGWEFSEGHPAAGHGDPGSREFVLYRRGGDNAPTPVGVTEMSWGSSEAKTPGGPPPSPPGTPAGCVNAMSMGFARSNGEPIQGAMRSPADVGSRMDTQRLDTEYAVDRSTESESSCHRERQALMEIHRGTT